MILSKDDPFIAHSSTLHMNPYKFHLMVVYQVHLLYANIKIFCFKCNRIQFMYINSRGTERKPQILFPTTLIAYIFACLCIGQPEKHWNIQTIRDYFRTGPIFCPIRENRNSIIPGSFCYRILVIKVHWKNLTFAINNFFPEPFFSNARSCFSTSVSLSRKA